MKLKFKKKSPLLVWFKEIWKCK